MDEATKAVVEAYDRQRKQRMRLIVRIAAIAAGFALILTAFLFRTQYPLRMEDRGLVHYTYSHVLLRDVTRYGILNTVQGHEVKYYVVYRNAGLYYEQETGFSVYSAHALKENIQPGVTNHSVIRESVEKYTFTDKFAKTYCYDAKTNVLKALFDASFAGGKIYLRFLCYGIGGLLMAGGTFSLCFRKKKNKGTI